MSSPPVPEPVSSPPTAVQSPPSPAPVAATPPTESSPPTEAPAEAPVPSKKKGKKHAAPAPGPEPQSPPAPPSEAPGPNADAFAPGPASVGDLVRNFSSLLFAIYYALISDLEYICSYLSNFSLIYGFDALFNIELNKHSF